MNKAPTITAEDVGIPSNNDKLSNKKPQGMVEWKQCPAITTYNHIKEQCIKLEGHAGHHEAWAKIIWDKGQRPRADVEIHLHHESCECCLCTDPIISKIKQEELARRGKA